MLAAAGTCCARRRRPAPGTGSVATGDPEPFQRLGRRFLGPEVGAPWTSRRTGVGVKLTVVGCSGSVPGPGLRRLVLPGRGTTASGCCSTSATARSARCSGTLGPGRRRRGRACPTCTPDHCLDLAPMIVRRVRHGRAAGAPAHPGARPGRHARPAGAGLRPAAREPGCDDLFDFRGVTPGERELGPVPVRFAPVNHPVPDARGPGQRRRPVAGLLGRHRASDGLVAAGRGRRRAAVRGVFARRRAATRRTCTSPAAQAGEHAAKAGAGRLLSPTCRRGTTPRGAATRRPPRSPVRPSWSPPAPCTSSSRPGTRAGPAARGCRRWCRPGRPTARCRARSGRRGPAASRTAGRTRAARGRARARGCRAGAASGRRRGSSVSSAASRSVSLPAPVSRTASPAVACGTNTCSSPSPAPAAKEAHSAVMSRTTGRPPVRMVSDLGAHRGESRVAP